MVSSLEELQKTKEQLKALTAHLIDDPNHSWDFINGVLSSKAFGKLSLWYWWGDLLIVKPGQKKAGSMQKLVTWKVNEDKTISFIGKKQK
jgi:hypothetical protein